VTGERILFVGRHLRRLDRSGRLHLPPPFRRRPAELGEERLALFTMEGCLGALPAGRAAAIQASGGEDPVEAHLRLLLREAVVRRPDREGRIVLPRAWRERASLEGQVLLAGCGDRFEIWPPRLFRALVDGAAPPAG
jgi:MraZ protein